MCRHLAYPFGNPRSIGALAPAVAERFYDSAVTMSMGSVDSGNLWLLPRIPLYSTNSPAIARLKIVLKCGSLSGKAAPAAPERIQQEPGRLVEEPAGTTFGGKCGQVS